MITTRTLVRLVACCAVSLADVAAFAADESVSPRTAGPADTRLIAEWMQVVDSADVVTLRHSVSLQRPVKFKSARPCVYRLTRVVGDVRLERPAPARFAEGLGLSERRPDSVSCRSGRCRSDPRRMLDRDTLVSQSLEVTFRRAGREVTFMVDGAEEIARVSDPSGRWACIHLANRIPGLVALARQAFWKDSLLDRIAPCEPAATDSESLILGSYVYVEELPEVIERPAPNYPNDARSANVSGTVLVQALIGKDGEVKSTAIVESIPKLDKAAVQAVERWRFRPAMANGKPIAVWVAAPVKFTLKDW